MTDEKSSVDLSGSVPDNTPADPVEETPKPAPEPPAPVAENPVDTDGVGTVKEPTADAPADDSGLSQSFRFNIAQMLRNIGPVESVLDEAYQGNRITSKMRDHLKRESLKFVAREICELTEEEIRRVK